MWTFDSLLGGAKKKSGDCRARDGWRARGGCACRDVAATFSGVDLALLRVGSTFGGFDTEPVQYRPAYLRLQRATLTYAAPFLAVRDRAIRSFARDGRDDARTRDYLALHLRGGDGEFARRFHATINRGFKELIAAYVAAAKASPVRRPVALYVASDAAFVKQREFRDGLAKLEAAVRGDSGDARRRAVRVVALRDVVTGDARDALAAATPGLEDGRALAAVPDLEMHLDLLLCASARLGFAGTAGSSVSSSIRTLRKFLLAEDKALEKLS